MKPAISVRNVSKLYHLGAKADGYQTFREALVSTVAAPFRRVLGGGEPKIGAHGKPVLFLHPKDFNGCLIELEQV